MEKEAESKDGLVERLFKHPLIQVMIVLSAPFFWFGQWADTRDVSISIYEAFVSNFTHNIELDKLGEVRVGANLRYLEEVFGDARLIKQSKKFPNAQYRYYHGGKYLLTLAVRDGRVLGYQIVSLLTDFRPQIPFSDQDLGESNLTGLQRFSGEFISDYVNLGYYLEPKTLGPEGLLLERQLGYIEYGATNTQAFNVDSALKRINTLMVRSQGEELLQAINKLRENLKPNLLSIGETTLEQAGDMLLTRYEYQAHFGEE